MQQREEADRDARDNIESPQSSLSLSLSLSVCVCVCVCVCVWQTEMRLTAETYQINPSFSEYEVSHTYICVRGFRVSGLGFKVWV